MSESRDTYKRGAFAAASRLGVRGSPGGIPMSTLRDIARTIPCAYCGAAADERCRTSSGARARYDHGARTQPIYDVRRMGFEEGQGDMLAALDEYDTWGHGYIKARRKSLERADD